MRKNAPMKTNGMKNRNAKLVYDLDTPDIIDVQPSSVTEVKIAIKE